MTGPRPHRRSWFTRASAPGSHTSTSTATFLAYGGPSLAALGMIALAFGDFSGGVVLTALGSILAAAGHWMIRR